MPEAAVGRVEVEIVGNTSGFEAALARARQLASSIGQTGGGGSGGSSSTNLANLVNDTRKVTAAAKELETGGGRLGESLEKLVGAFASLESPMRPIAERIESMGGLFTKTGLAIGGFAVATAAAALAAKEALDAFASEEKQLLTLEAQLKATGDASGQTQSSLVEMAEAISKTTLATKEQTLAAESLLLTFRKVSGEEFPRTLKAAQDLAAVGFGSITSNARLLGRALEDPVHSLTTLRRAGVVFTAAQQELIKSLIQSGQQLSAQNEILKTVEAQVGGAGSAQAGGLAGAYHELGEAIENVTVAAGGWLSRVFNVPGMAKAAANALNSLVDTGDKLTITINNQVYAVNKYETAQEEAVRKAKEKDEQDKKNLETQKELLRIQKQMDDLASGAGAIGIGMPGPSIAELHPPGPVTEFLQGAERQGMQALAQTVSDVIQLYGRAAAAGATYGAAQKDLDDKLSAGTIVLNEHRDALLRTTEQQKVFDDLNKQGLAPLSAQGQALAESTRQLDALSQELAHLGAAGGPVEAVQKHLQEMYDTMKQGAGIPMFNPDLAGIAVVQRASQDQIKAQQQAAAYSRDAKSAQEKETAARAEAAAVWIKDETDIQRAQRITLAGENAKLDAIHAETEANEARALQQKQDLQTRQLDLQLVGKSVEEQARLRTELQLRQDAEKRYHDTHQKYTADEQKADEAYATQVGQDTADIAAKQLQVQTAFETQTQFLSDTEQKIAQAMQGIFGSDWQSHMNDAINTQIRFNNALKQTADMASSFATTFVDDILDGKTAVDSLTDAMNNLERTIINMVLDNSVKAMFQLISGYASGSGSISNLFGLGGTPHAQTGGYIGSTPLHRKKPGDKLGYDEFPAILHVGERVIPRGGGEPKNNLSGEQMLRLFGGVPSFDDGWGGGYTNPYSGFSDPYSTSASGVSTSGPSGTSSGTSPGGGYSISAGSSFGTGYSSPSSSSFSTSATGFSTGYGGSSGNFTNVGEGGGSLSTVPGSSSGQPGQSAYWSPTATMVAGTPSGGRSGFSQAVATATGFFSSALGGGLFGAPSALGVDWATDFAPIPVIRPGTPNVRLGQRDTATDNSVFTVQTRLNQAGYGIAIDGIAGPETMAAVTALEQRMARMPGAFRMNENQPIHPPVRVFGPQDDINLQRLLSGELPPAASTFGDALHPRLPVMAPGSLPSPLYPTDAPRRVTTTPVSGITLGGGIGGGVGIGNAPTSGAGTIAITPYPGAPPGAAGGPSDLTPWVTPYGPSVPGGPLPAVRYPGAPSAPVYPGRLPWGNIGGGGGIRLPSATLTPWGPVISPTTAGDVTAPQLTFAPGASQYTVTPGASQVTSVSGAPQEIFAPGATRVTGAPVVRPGSADVTPPVTNLPDIPIPPGLIPAVPAGPGFGGTGGVVRPGPFGPGFNLPAPPPLPTGKDPSGTGSHGLPPVVTPGKNLFITPHMMPTSGGDIGVGAAGDLSFTYPGPNDYRRLQYSIQKHWQELFGGGDDTSTPITTPPSPVTPPIPWTPVVPLSHTIPNPFGPGDRRPPGGLSFLDDISGSQSAMMVTPGGGGGPLTSAFNINDPFAGAFQAIPPALRGSPQIAGPRGREMPVDVYSAMGLQRPLLAGSFGVYPQRPPVTRDELYFGGDLPGRFTTRAVGTIPMTQGAEPYFTPGGLAVYRKINPIWNNVDWNTPVNSAIRQYRSQVGPYEEMPFSVHHTGGVVGSTPVWHRMLPVRLLTNAPRLQQGLEEGEYPAILHHGETVTPAGGRPSRPSPQIVVNTPPQPAPTVMVNVVNNSSANVSTHSQDDNGNIKLDIIIDELVSGKMRDGGSKISKTLSSMGARAQPLRR